MAKKIELITFDIDGTILNDRKKLTDYTRKVLNKAAEKGVWIIPNTGRSIFLLLPILKKLKGVQYVSSLNGAVITQINNR